MYHGLLALLHHKPLKPNQSRHELTLPEAPKTRQTHLAPLPPTSLTCSPWLLLALLHHKLLNPSQSLFCAPMQLQVQSLRELLFQSSSCRWSCGHVTLRKSARQSVATSWPRSSVPRRPSFLA